MKARRTHFSNAVARLPGGTEDNDLWHRQDIDSRGDPIRCSVWEPDPAERQAIAEGRANVMVVTWGTNVAPMTVLGTTEPLGAPPHRRPDIQPPV